MALLVAVRAWAELLKDRQVQVEVKGDNLGALRLAVKLASSQAQLNGLGAELALTLEIYGLQEILTAYLPGCLGEKTDVLSRVDSPEGPQSVPAKFKGIKERKLASRDSSFFTAWDFTVND